MIKNFISIVWVTKMFFNTVIKWSFAVSDIIRFADTCKMIICVSSFNYRFRGSLSGRTEQLCNLTGFESQTYMKYWQNKFYFCINLRAKYSACGLAYWKHSIVSIFGNSGFFLILKKNVYSLLHQIFWVIILIKKGF